MIGDILILVLPLLILWRVLHAEATAPDDPMLWLVAACIVTCRYVYRHAARWDAAHRIAYARRLVAWVRRER
jgi:hypothetical protein